MGGDGRSLAVQVVLYDDHLDSMIRLADAVAAAARFVRDHSDVTRIVWRIGDSSRWPCLADDAAAVLSARTRGSIDEVSVTFFGANLGSGGGSNALARLGDEDLLWVLNPDTYPAPDSLWRLLDTIDRDEQVALAESRQIPIEHQKTYDPVSGATSWACGFSVLARRSAFDSVGGFDDRFFPLYCDDVDLSWRLRLAGWKVLHVPRSVVFHDKQIDADGGVRWTPTAARSSTIAALWLYRRYGRPDLEASALADLGRSADPVALSVLDEYHRRVADDDVPRPLEGADHVATFVDGQFAPRRFSYVG